MFFSNIHIQFPNDIDIHYSNYNNIIITNFIKKYIEKKNYNKEFYEEAVIYSKYYLYYKTLNCIYDKYIMDIILSV